MVNFRVPFHAMEACFGAGGSTLQAAKQLAPASITIRSDDPSDDGLQKRERFLVAPRREGETEAQFLKRFNQPFRAHGLPRLYGTSADHDSYEVVGLRSLEVHEYIAEACLALRSPTGIEHDALVELHTAGEAQAAALVIPYVALSGGIRVALTRESRYTLYFNRREMRLARRQDLRETKRGSRKGWVNAFARAFSRSAETTPIAYRKLIDVPVSAPHDQVRLAHAARSVVARKLGQLFDRPGIRPVQFTWLREVPENTGRSTTWVQIFALEIVIEDPEELKRLIENRGRFGPGHMKSRFVPLAELEAFDGLDRHDLVDAISLAGLLVFLQALKANKLRRIRRKSKSPTTATTTVASPTD